MQKPDFHHQVDERLTKGPILIDPAKASYVRALGLAGFEALDRRQMVATLGGGDFWSGGDDNPLRPYAVSDGVLTIPVKGVLLSDCSVTLGSYFTGYGYVAAAMLRGFADTSVKSIALIVDSPGGDASEVFDIVDMIYAAKTKPVIAFAESAYSAAYAIASLADQIVVTRTGGVGSIGVVTMHADYSAALDQAGVKVTYIYAGDHKVDGNPYEPLPDDVRQNIQAQINEIYDVFVSTVARNRGMEEAAVRATQAATYSASQSLSVGLADKIGSINDTLAYFVAVDKGDSAMADESQAEVQMQAMVDEATQTGFLLGAENERKRVSSILDSDEAKSGRETLARHLAFNTNMTAEAAIGILSVSPKQEVQQAAEAKSEPNPFADAMNRTETPNVGAVVSGGTEETGEGRAQNIIQLARAQGLRAVKPV